MVGMDTVQVSLDQHRVYGLTQDVPSILMLPFLVHIFCIPTANGYKGLCTLSSYEFLWQQCFPDINRGLCIHFSVLNASVMTTGGGGS